MVALNFFTRNVADANTFIGGYFHFFSTDPEIIEPNIKVKTETQGKNT